jgi:cobalt/nickel transport system permease protein
MLFAVHISDGVLAWPWIACGFGVAGVLAVAGSLRLREEEIPRIAVMSAAFFVASLIRVPTPVNSVHLIMNGLVGLILGWRAAVAIPLGLCLQAVLFGHGGVTTLGVNTVIMELPALGAWFVFHHLGVKALAHRARWGWLIGFCLGVLTVAATAGLNFLVLLFGGVGEWDALAYTVLFLHLPVAGIEGVILGATVSFLARVKPEMLGLKGKPTTAG